MLRQKIRMLVLTPIAVAAAGLAFLLGSCSDSKPSASSPKTPAQTERAILRIGYRPKALVDITPIVMAESKAAGTKVQLEFVPLASPPEGFARLNAGELDAIAGMPTEAVFAQLIGSTGAPRFTAYAAEVDLKGAGWVAVVASKESGAKSLADLAGKTVASLPTDQASWLLKRLLIAAGIPSGEVKLARYNTANPVAGLRSGEHAAVFGPEPASALALADGGVVLARGPLSELLFDGKPVPVALSIVSNDWIKAHPDAYTEYVGLVRNAIKEIGEHPDRVRNLFAKPEYGGIAPEVRALIELPVMREPDAEIIAVTQKLIDELVRDGLLKQGLDASAVFPPVKKN